MYKYNFVLHLLGSSQPGKKKERKRKKSEDRDIIFYI